MGGGDASAVELLNRYVMQHGAAALQGLAGAGASPALLAQLSSQAESLRQMEAANAWAQWGQMAPPMAPQPQWAMAPQWPMQAPMVDPSLALAAQQQQMALAAQAQAMGAAAWGGVGLAPMAQMSPGMAPPPSAAWPPADAADGGGGAVAVLPPLPPGPGPPLPAPGPPLPPPRRRRPTASRRRRRHRRRPRRRRGAGAGRGGVATGEGGAGVLGGAAAADAAPQPDEGGQGRHDVRDVGRRVVGVGRRSPALCPQRQRVGGARAAAGALSPLARRDADQERGSVAAGVTSVE